MQIDSPATGRSILTIQSFDGSYERQVQRAFEVLRARPAMEIGSGSTQVWGKSRLQSFHHKPIRQHLWATLIVYYQRPLTNNCRKRCEIGHYGN